MLFRWDEFDPSHAPLTRAAFGQPFFHGFAPFDEFRRRVERAFDEYDREGREGRTGALALRDEGTALVLTTDLPGVTEADVSLTLNKNVLTIGVKRTLTPPEGMKALRQERPAFQATRNLALPARVDAEKVRATLRDGEIGRAHV